CSPGACTRLAVGSVDRELKDRVPPDGLSRRACRAPPEAAMTPRSPGSELVDWGASSGNPSIVLIHCRSQKGETQDQSVSRPNAPLVFRQFIVVPPEAR